MAQHLAREPFFPGRRYGSPTSRSSRTPQSAEAFGSCAADPVKSRPKRVREQPGYGAIREDPLGKAPKMKGPASASGALGERALHCGMASERIVGRSRKPSLPYLFAFAAFVGGATARAQSLAPAAAPQGDDLGARAAWGYSAPLRWSLMNGAPRLGPTLPGCEEQAGTRGSSVGGLPNEYFVAWRLTPPSIASLYLVGFSRHGCAVDAGAGGGLVLTIPLRADLFLTASTGLYGLPRNGLATPERLHEARVDLGFRPSLSQVVTLGIGTRGVSVGGLW
jgi:hypothetical protein